MEVSTHGGTPIAGWFTMENTYENGLFMGTPISGNHHMIEYKATFNAAMMVIANQLNTMFECIKRTTHYHG
jgi:hypothetical protein